MLTGYGLPSHLSRFPKHSYGLIDDKVDSFQNFAIHDGCLVSKPGCRTRVRVVEVFQANRSSNKLSIISQCLPRGYREISLVSKWASLVSCASARRVRNYQNPNLHMVLNTAFVQLFSFFSQSLLTDFPSKGSRLQGRNSFLFSSFFSQLFKSRKMTFAQHWFSASFEVWRT